MSSHKPPRSSAYPDMGVPQNPQPYNQMIRELVDGQNQQGSSNHGSSHGQGHGQGQSHGQVGGGGNGNGSGSGNNGTGGHHPHNHAHGGHGPRTGSFSSPGPNARPTSIQQRPQAISSGSHPGLLGGPPHPSPLSHVDSSGSAVSAGGGIGRHGSAMPMGTTTLGSLARGGDDQLSHSRSPEAMSVGEGDMSDEDMSDVEFQSPDATGTSGSKRKRSNNDTGGKGGKSKSGKSSLTASGKEKRKRQVQSCSECRRRKIKCDKKFPCGPCVLRNDQSICREVEKHTPTSTGCASSQDLLQVQYRLAALESVLAQAGILPSGALDEMLGGKGKLNFLSAGGVIGPGDGGGLVDGEGIQSRLRKIARGVGMAINDDDDEESDTEGAALTLEQLAFGRRRTGNTSAMPHAVGYIPDQGHGNIGTATGVSYLPNNGPVKLEQGEAAAHGFDGRMGSALNEPTIDRVPPELMPNRPLKLYGSLHGPVNASALDALEPGEVFSIFYQRSDVFVKALLSVMPDRRRGELLVKTYIARVEWLHRCIHIPTFMQQCQELWDTPLERIVPNIYTPFLSLYLIVLCLGLYFMDQNEAALHFTPEEIEALPGVWLTASRGSLWMGDFMANHTIEHLQCIVLIGIFLNNRDRADAAWSLLGAAIKMAQNMGLSRLGAEIVGTPDSPAPAWKAPWQSLIKREIGRRIWWNLVFLDWSLAPSYNFASSIQPDQIKTALPANIDDDDIVEGRPLVAKPLSERTGMSYHLARLRFAEISQRQIWQANASPHPPYSFILSVDTELRKAMADLPEHFTIDLEAPPPPPEDMGARVAYWERIIINLSGQSRLLRLHRPWLSRGYKDRKYEYSREQCIRAARTSLRLMSDEYGTAVFLEKWWIPLFYVTVAAVVVLIDLLRATREELNGAEAMEKRQEVEDALEKISQSQGWSMPARGAVKVIEYLLDELTQRRAGRTILEGEPESEHGAHAGLQKVIKNFMADHNKASTTSPPSVHSGQTPALGQGQPIASPGSDGVDRRPSVNIPAGGPQSYQQMFPSQTFSAAGNGQGSTGRAAPVRPPMGQPGFGGSYRDMAPSSAGFDGFSFQDQNAAFGNYTGPPAASDGQDIDLESMLAAYMPNQDQVALGNEMFMPTGGAANWNWDSSGQEGLGGAPGDVFSQAGNPYRGWMG